ncbi:MAG: aminopeptidase [Crocinitomicaceae bacterium]|nr:aminopeptidase [Crocinitomicaceae bacterium]|tara:strand:+ start:2448 stop:4310 length:1863 start_codon:yes stop_codon:yes gene_type:complete
MKYFYITTALTLILFSPGCISSDQNDRKSQAILEMKRATDFHSFSKPEEAVVTHLNWNASVNFDDRIIRATAIYDIDVRESAERIILDCVDLTIESVTVDGKIVEWSIGPEQPFIGQPLSIPINGKSKRISIQYASDPAADALLWVEGDQPFLFTQSQAILARTWIPCQDSPGIRFTYEAHVDVPEGTMALMSATNPTEQSSNGHYDFRMDQPIPSYLLALAVGNVEFRSVGPHTGVYAVPELIDAAEYEFGTMEDLLVAAEGLYGKYAWERYDLLVLPAAFPFGGMENPRLTFATPTIIAGDRSLVSLVAHELAHSWSGNLVTNSTWDDFWLNEGFTVYFEQRIMEAVYGREISEMLATLSYQGLVDEVDEIMDTNPDDTHLKLHLQSRNPDDGMTAIAYDKGYFFIRLIEETVGRESFDAFLKAYFNEHAFNVMDTDRFIAYLKENLLNSDERLSAINLDAWIFGPGLPSNCPKVRSERIEQVDANLAAWEAGSLATSELPWESWVYQERYRFLSNLSDATSAERMEELDVTWNISTTGNNEVLFAWLEQSVRSHYAPSYNRLESFLINIGRRKFLTPLYRAMVETDQTEMALNIYKQARPNYHSVATGTMDELLRLD